MVPIATLLSALVAGSKARDTRRATVIVALIFGITLAVQTALVAAGDGLSTAGDIAIYVVVQIVSLLVALGIARMLLRWRTSAALVVITASRSPLTPLDQPR